MITLPLIAVGLVAVAALLTTRSAPVVRMADERGITLQTLIVTAVLVLMAVAAGVVIVAITRSASDNLTDVDPDIAGNCNSAEFYDPVVAAGEVPEYNLEREVPGSADGCAPVCVLTYPTIAMSDDKAAKLRKFEDYTLELDRDLKVSELFAITGNQAYDLNAARRQADYDPITTLATLPFGTISGKKLLFQTSTSVYQNITAKGTEDTMKPGRENIPKGIASDDISSILEDTYGIKEIRISPNQTTCHAYDHSGKIAEVFA